LPFPRVRMTASPGRDAMVIVTERNEFRILDLRRMKSLLTSPVIVDLQNISRPQSIARAGFVYRSAGIGENVGPEMAQPNQSYQLAGLALDLPCELCRAWDIGAPCVF